MSETNVKKCSFELDGNFPKMFEKYRPKGWDDSLYIKNMVIGWLIDHELALEKKQE